MWLGVPRSSCFTHAVQPPAPAFIGGSIPKQPEAFSIGAFVIEHLGKPADDVAPLVAGVEGVLNAYKSILKSDPEAKSKALDNLLAKQREGKLAGFVREASKKVMDYCQINLKTTVMDAAEKVLGVKR